MSTNQKPTRKLKLKVGNEFRLGGVTPLQKPTKTKPKLVLKNVPFDPSKLNHKPSTSSQPFKPATTKLKMNPHSNFTPNNMMGMNFGNQMAPMPMMMPQPVMMAQPFNMQNMPNMNMNMGFTPMGFQPNFMGNNMQMMGQANQNNQGNSMNNLNLLNMNSMGNLNNGMNNMGNMMKPNTINSFNNIPNNNNSPMNFIIDEKTKELAKKLKLKKKNKETKAEDKKKAEEDKKAEEEKKAAAELKQKKFEEDKVQQQAAQLKKVESKEEVQDVSDSESYESDVEDINYDDFPQERPKVIRYTKAMILEYIARESKREFEDELIFEDLVREISKVSKQSGNFHRGGGGGNNYESRGGNSGGIVLSKAKLSKEDAARLAKFRKDDNWAQRNVDNVKEIDLVKRQINLKLFQLTAENFEECYKFLKEYCDNMDHCEILIDLLVDKAWGQPKYTKIYGQMCTQLGANIYQWGEGDSDGALKSYCKKKFKSLVVNKIRSEFLQGFKKFKEQMINWQKNSEIDEDEFFEKYLKGKKKLTGNMSFISELYLLGYLPHKVMRFITYKLIVQFTDEFTRRNLSTSTKMKFPIYNEYISLTWSTFWSKPVKMKKKQ